MNDDPFDVLVAAASRDRSWEQPADLDADARAAGILQRVMSGGVVVPLDRRRRRHRRIVAGALAIGVLAAGSAVAVAAVNWTRRAPSTVRALACWNHAPLGDDGVILGIRFVRGEDPIETCRRQWALPENVQYGVGDDLVICVADYGTAVVIPGVEETACDVAGLDRFDGRIAPDVWAIAAVEDEMSNRLLAGECMDVDAATDALRETLDRHGLDDWTITVGEPLGEGETCSTFAFDEQTSTATIVPLPAEML